MWRNDPAAFAKTHTLSLALARRLQATAEHLTPRCKGGDDGGANIVAACLYCNTQRHRARTTLRPDEYLRKVRKRVASNRWHSVRLEGS
ncbi:HNH endonuclease [Sphingomonas hylomeconis]|uniref:HNH endonuclease n=1 Tax=Sphingomonas hylomeconis TaxID=1395958 RepID=A0ABV7SSR0_9SPHN